MCIRDRVGRSTAAVLAVTSAGGVRTRTAKLDFALEAGECAAMAAALNENLAFRSAADVGQAQMRTAAASLGENGAVFYPVLSAAYKLLKEAGRASVYLEGQENLLNYPEAERSFRTLLEFFADDAAVKRCISPKTERTTVDVYKRQYMPPPQTRSCAPSARAGCWTAWWTPDT